MRARSVFRIGGTERMSFLQNLVTNDVDRLGEGAVWTALLTPQGKYLADFLLVPETDDSLLLDVDAELAPGLIQRLSMYKLRSDVTIEATDITVASGPGSAPDGAFADPRHPDLGWRAYDGRDSVPFDYDTLRIEHCVPESGIELVPNDTYPLEAGFERLNGVDFKKGCYVGQEVTARMKHKTELKKGFRSVAVSNAAPVGTDIVTEDGKVAGTLFSQAGGKGIAYLRFDRAKGTMTAEEAEVRLLS